MDSLTEEDAYAVVVQNAYKKYGNGPHVLNNFNMHIPKNQIYGLLGSSGCGKTTLLKTLIGAIDLDYGRIRINTQNIKEIGFMPQETALFEEFTIAETFRFYANLYKIPEDKFQSKVKELQEILDLPREGQICSTLSGGQIRRVSIAVTILHSPLLVVLDEPTSGLDPLLANLFWRYLQDLSGQGQTIIITTHYIEEARQANTVGLMRHGILLAEDAPENLINHFNVDTLEDVFLHLCKKQNRPDEIEPEKKIPYQKIFVESGPYISWAHTKAIVYKNFKWVQRNLVVFLGLSFVLNAFVIFESHEAMKYFPPMSIGVINHSPGGCQNYDYNMNFNCTAGDTNFDLSCLFLKMWEEQTDTPLVMYDTLDKALLDGKKRKITAVFDIPSNFTSGVIERFSNGWNASDDLIHTSIMDMRFDTSDFLPPFKIEYDLRTVMKNAFRKTLIHCDYYPKLADIPPVNVNFRTFLSDGVNQDIHSLSTHIAVSCMTAICFIDPILLLAISLMFEKLTGAYSRTIFGGVKLQEILAGYTICFMILSCINVAFMMFIHFFFYQNTMGNLLIMYLLLNLLSLSGTFYAFIVILLMNDAILNAGYVISVTVTNWFFTGFFWPIEAMMPALQYVSMICLPTTLVLKSELAVIWKNADFLQPQVLHGFEICIAHIIFYLGVLYFMLRNRKVL